MGEEEGRSLGQRACLCAIQGYRRYISPILPDSCIYTPTCSEYTYQAIAKYGVPRGIYLGAKRILRCNPFREGGYDPVP